ncbi:MAG: hypothetical protein MUD06_00245 [Rhodospirillales bacterium]|jgi:hypothetical protein|nr:hypothetical protein [Rhodospirillales bacterium]
MKKSFVAGIAMGMFALTAAATVTPAHADTTAAKKALMDAIDKCEMQQKTDARESCMDQAWAAYKKANAK